MDTHLNLPPPPNFSPVDCVPSYTIKDKTLVYNVTLFISIKN